MIMIIDSHLHLSITEQNTTFQDAAKALLFDMNKNKIDKAVVIPDNVKSSNCADIDMLLEIFADNPNIYLIGSPNPFKELPLDLKRLDILLKNKKIIGLKIFPGHDKIYISNKRFDPILELCQKHKVPLVIHTGANSGNFDVMKYNSPEMIVEIARKKSNLKIIISHYFWPKLDYCFEVTTGIKNIYFDTSGLADKEVVNASGGIEKVREIIKKTISRNPESVIFGTDYPMGEFEDHIRLINSLNISQEIKTKIFSENASNLFLI